MNSSGRFHVIPKRRSAKMCMLENSNGIYQLTFHTQDYGEA